MVFGSKRAGGKIPGAETMLRKQRESGIHFVALAMSIPVLMTAITVYIFAAKVWWFPPAITDLGHELIRNSCAAAHYGVVFVAAQFGLAIAVYRFAITARKRRTSKATTR